MTQHVSDVLRIFRLAIGRRNQNDPDSSDDMLIGYVNDFINLSMSDDVKVFENFGTFSFTIDETLTDGVFSLDGTTVNANELFVNYSLEAFISLLDPEGSSVSWNRLPIYQDPGEFYAIWGINNENILIPGYPTNMLFYGNDFVFRTIPNTGYLVKVYGYKRNAEFDTEQDSSTQKIPFDYWLRYIAYGAALNYARDFRYAPDVMQQLKESFAHERKYLLTRTHNQIKNSRCLPRF